MSTSVLIEKRVGEADAGAQAGEIIETIEALSAEQIAGTNFEAQPSLGV